ncbi:MAG: iron-containing alcohol dehydrogenase [Deltaproteobacteria bacterium]|nr:iron-containing alcohol dehydrogenase [Deltaproteobacteria bacterium]
MGYDTDLSFLHYAPVRIVYGAGSLSELPSELGNLGCERAMIVTDKDLAARTDLVERVKKVLGRRCAGVYAEVQPDSSVQIVDTGAAKAKELGVDVLVSLGGGSSIDSAKAIAIVHTLGGSIRDHQGFQGLTAPTTPHVAIPTTAGTGSEATRYALIRDEDSRQKLLFGDFHIFPRVGILDPKLTTGMPHIITAGTGMDALTHGIEGLHSAQREPIADALALHAIRLIRKHLPVAIKTPNDLLARGMMLLAANMAGTAFDNAQVGLVHAIAHTVGARHHVHHGLANSIALPHVMRFNGDAAAEWYRLAGDAFDVPTQGMSDEAAVDKIASAIEAFAAECGLPVRYRDVKVPESDLEAIAEVTLTDGAIVYNPKPVTDPAEILPVLRACY